MNVFIVIYKQEDDLYIEGVYFTFEKAEKDLIKAGFKKSKYYRRYIKGDIMYLISKHKIDDKDIKIGD